MTQNTLGRNLTFPIYNADGTAFHGLELKKSTSDSVVMSLGDKITGDVYYIDNTLAVTMQEYIILNGVKYTLVSPPTIVREGMVTDNTQLKGMTKYSFTFYHPMYMLGNIPFTDIAVIPAQEKYLSQNKTFSWIGTFSEFVDKLNANLASTEWLVIMSSTVTQEKQNEIPEEVLSFDKQFISNALKTGYDTWEVPFVITSIKEGETGYAQGKRFLITFGLPTQEIYAIDAQGHKTSTPFIFQFGKGVGLKNNSRTPRNNKIVTRISGYGSERNVPFGYPQIVWEGDQSWDYTINNDSSAYGSYPIYDGIVGGQRVRLIKHPFTRAHIMPPVYVKSVNRKVNPYASGYNPDTTIIDYYDATQAENYPNPINLNAPSVEIHEFEDIYPRLDNKRLISVSPYEETPEMISKSTFNTRIQAFKALSNNENEKSSLQDCYDSFDVEGVYYIEGQGGSYTFRFDIIERKDYSNGTWYHVKYTSDNINFEYIVWDGTRSPVFDVQWDDTMDDDGNYKQGYFKIKLPYLDFDLYACAAVTQEMKINMRGGLCMGCTFPIQVDWDDYKANFYDSEGNFDPQIGEGHPRDGEKYPDSSREEIDVIVKKDNETFGKLMPNTYQLPITNDEFVILGISLPTSYITNAELELADAMKEYMLENNVHYYDYPLKFDEHFFATNTGILEQIQNNNIVRFQYAGAQMPLYIKQITIKYGDKPLPQYDITLTDDVEIVLNQIGQVTDDVSRMRVQVSELQKYYSENLIQEINSKLSKIVDDVCQGRITFQQGLNAIGSVVFSDEIRSPQFETGLYTGRGWRIDQLGNAELESLKVRSYLEVVELIINRLQAQEGDTLFTDNDQIDKVDMVVNENDNSVSYVLSLKEKYQGYVTGQMYGNVVKGIINTLAAKQAGVSDVQDSQTVEIDGSNTYYTSWMRVIGTHNTDNTLGVNQIRVVLYGDNYTPAGKNFAPCELMTIARWGCVDYSDPDDPNYETIKSSIERRQRVFMISTTDGRVVKYTGVDSPILRNGNYGVTIGELPEFVKNYSDVRAILNQVGEHTDWLYAQGVVVGNFIKIDKDGLPEINIIDCGDWVNGASVQTPTPRNGIYLYNEWNEDKQQYETHDVWHNGEKWRCLQHQPVVSNGVTTYYEPTDNSLYWRKLLSAGEAAAIAYANTEKISILCEQNGSVSSQIVKTLSFGMRVGTNAATNIRVITSSSLPTGVSWSATQQGQGNLTISTNATAGGMVGGVTFQVTGTFGGKDYVSYVTIALIGTIKGDSPYFADLDNEMDSVACDKNGVTTSPQTVSCHASMWKGSTPQTITGLSCKINSKSIGTSYNTDGYRFSGDVSTGYCEIGVKSNITIATNVEAIITVSATIDGANVSRDLTLTINGVRAGADGTPATIFKLSPSTSSIKRDKSDTLTPTSPMTCDVQKIVGNAIPTRATTSDGVLRYRVDGDITSATDGTAITINSGQVSYTSSNKYIVFAFFAQGTKLVDKERIPIIYDGVDGTSPIFADVTNEMDSVACDKNGYTTSAQTINGIATFWKGSTPQSITSLSCKVNGNSLGTSYNADGYRFSGDVSTGSYDIGVQSGILISSKTIATLTITANVEGSPMSCDLEITINGVRAGRDGNNGADAVLFGLSPTLDHISFARTSSGGLTPASRRLSLNIKKTVGATNTLITITDSGLTIRYSTSTMPTTSTGGYAWGSSNGASGLTWSNNVATIANSVTFTNIYITAFNSNGTLVDRETVPIIKDGQDGQDGQDAHEINPNILLRTIFDRGIGFVKEEWESNWAYTRIDTATDTIIEGRKSIRINAVNASNFVDFKQDVYGRVKAGTWYTLSFCYFATQAFNTFIYSNSNSYACIDQSAGIYIDGVLESTVPQDGNVQWANNWQGNRHTITFKTKSSFDTTYFYIIFRAQVGGQVAICMPKLEIGEVATAYMAHEDDLKGSTGARGKVGRFFYYAGEWNDFGNTDSWVVSDAQAPYFGYTPTNSTHGYYVFNPDENGTYTKKQIHDTYGDPTANHAPWIKMWDDFKYIITEAIFGNYAHFGSSIINGDYLLSQYGYMRGFGNTKTPIADSTQYIYADPDDMFGEEEWDLTHDENIIVNKYLNKEITNNNSYSKIESISAFEIKKDRWYTIWLTGYCEGDNNTHTLTVAIGTSSSNIITASAISVKGYNSNRSDGLYDSYLTFKATANLSTCYMYVKNDSRDASGLVHDIVMRYAQFVPTLCIDMKSGKLVANNIKARGELHADSFVYNMIYGNSNGDTITVNEESIINLGTGAVSTVVKLPSPSTSKGRRIEIYNHSTSWQITWVGANSTSALQAAYGSNLGYRTSYSLQLNYMLVYCDGTTWWCLKAE